MMFCSAKFVLRMLSVVAFSNVLCEGQYFQFKNYEPISSTPLPFPPCRIDNIECLRRGLRTFFFLMESGHLGMKSIDPIILNSVTVALPNEQMSILMRRVNVTGAKWSKLVNRKFNLQGGKNGVQFASNLHVTGEITMSMAGRIDPFVAHITMDLHEIESNITYVMGGQKGYDNEDYIFIGPERIAVRNTRLPTFFVQPDEAPSSNINLSVQTFISLVLLIIASLPGLIYHLRFPFIPLLSALILHRRCIYDRASADFAATYFRPFVK